MKKILSFIIVFSFLSSYMNAQSFSYTGNFKNNDAGILVSISNIKDMTSAEIWLHGKRYQGQCKEENGILKGLYEEDKVKKIFTLMRQNGKYFVNVENYTYEVDLTEEKDKQPTAFKMSSISARIPNDVALPLGTRQICTLGKYEFTLPEKWKFEHQSDLCYKMSTTLDNTMWMVRSHNCTNADELHALLAKDILYDNSPLMELTDGGILLYGANGLIATREGFTKAGERKKYSVIGLLAPGGGGTLVIGAAHVNDFPKDNAIAAKSIANSVTFMKESDPDTHETWLKLLNNRMLVAMNPESDESLSLKNDGMFYYRNGKSEPLKGIWTVHINDKKVTIVLASDDQKARIFTLEKVYSKAEVKLNGQSFQVRSLK
jgi:hypothetical protein